MTFVHREKSGTFRINERKNLDSHPDFTGSGKIEGKDVWIDVWRNKDKNGKEYFKITWKNKDLSPAKEVAKTVAKQAPPVADEFDSEIPF